jgi:hypothetical protein
MCVICISEHREEGIAKESRYKINGWFICVYHESLYLCSMYVSLNVRMHSGCMYVGWVGR